jgi:hypothetical protein
VKVRWLRQLNYTLLNELEKSRVINLFKVIEEDDYNQYVQNANQRYRREEDFDDYTEYD